MEFTRAFLLLGYFLFTGFNPAYSETFAKPKDHSSTSEVPTHPIDSPTMNIPFSNYIQPHGRSLADYDQILLPKNGSLINELEEGDTAIDVGGGQGVAFHQLAERKNIEAIVLNMQPTTGIGFTAPLQGTWTYIPGKAEETLSNYRGRAKLITDLWGAFSYSTGKDQIFEKIWAALKPGGKAYILFHPTKTPASVGEDDFGGWLVKKYPQFVSIHGGGYPNQFAEIICIDKPLDAPAELNLHLKTISAKMVKSRRNTLPEVKYVE